MAHLWTIYKNQKPCLYIFCAECASTPPTSIPLTEQRIEISSFIISLCLSRVLESRCSLNCRKLGRPETPAPAKKVVRSLSPEMLQPRAHALVRSLDRGVLSRLLVWRCWRSLCTTSSIWICFSWGGTYVCTTGWWWRWWWWRWLLFGVLQGLFLRYIFITRTSTGGCNLGQIIICYSPLK